jgi:branched-chain amino acid transport system substrate-binding protein
MSLFLFLTCETFNNHPIQNICVRGVVKEGDVLTNKIVATAFENHKDAYADQCKM